MRLSIITPFYNTDNNLFGRLLESINNQTDNDFEWVIVNDCSDESHENFLENSISNSEVKNCVLINNKKNSGAAISRNRGIQAISGDYIVFVDSDDYIENDFVKTINDCIAEKNTDIIFFDYQRQIKQKIIRCQTLQIDRITNDKNRILLGMTTNVCGKVIKASIINNNDLEFPNLLRYEDWSFMTKAVYCAKSYYYLKERYLYTYIDNSNSIVHRLKSDGSEFAKKAFEDLESIVSDELILNVLYIREVLYTSIRDKICIMKKREFYKYIHGIEGRVPNWNKYKEIKKFYIKQRIVLKLYEYRMYYFEKTLLMLLK